MEPCLRLSQALPSLPFPRRERDGIWGNGGRFRMWLYRGVINSPLLTFVDIFLWRVDHQWPVSHPQPSDSTFSSHRWLAIHGVGSTYWCPWHDICYPHAAAIMHMISESLIDQICHYLLLLQSPPKPQPVSWMEKSREFEVMGIPSWLGLGRNLVRGKLHFF